MMWQAVLVAAVPGKAAVEKRAAQKMGMRMLVLRAVFL